MISKFIFFMNKFTNNSKNNKKDKNYEFYVLTMIFNSDIIILLNFIFKKWLLFFFTPYIPYKIKT